ncbi:MAG: ATP-dependent Clp protease adaptor ClpS [Ignavibacteriae bacterium]|nr:ATP-dependent Clp protease adaptor ClpS [Ignavibacteriota bacterium]
MNTTAVYNSVVETDTELEEDIGIGMDLPSRVILFNDDIHSFDEVIGQLIKAIHCDSIRANAIAWEVHSRGKSAVFEGDMPNCIRVSGVLEEIGLHTQIEV